jgi:hypothetical protein
MLVACASTTTGLCWVAQPAAAIPCATITGKGAIVTGTAASTPTALAVGTDGQMLVACNTEASGLCWISQPAAAIPCSVLNAKGSLVTTATPSTPVALAVGTDGQILYANSACATGLEWGVRPITCLDFDAKGDLLVGAAADSFATLGVGTDGQALLACSTAPSGICWGVPTVAQACPTTLGTVYGFVSGSSVKDQNVGLGYNTLVSKTAGAGNTAIGSCALGLLVSASGNVAVGAGALKNTTNGATNTAIGYNVGGSVQGSGNVLVGQLTGAALALGDSNTFVGNGAAASQTDGCFNVAIGPGVFLANSTGSCQLVIGFSGTDNWLTGDSTKAIKPGAGIIDCANVCGTAGQVLMSNGSNAICWATPAATPAATPTVAGIVLGCTASSRTALGTSALLSNTTGTLNTAIGAFVLSCNTTGGGNTATGVCALRCNTVGCSNTADGIQALYNNTTGNFNTATGNAALYSNTAGSLNVAVGNSAGCLITTGCQNVAVGPNVQLVSATASCQLAIGFSTTENWLTGTSTKAIKPGAGIIDCANSCGTAGQVLMSNGANAICWGAAGGPAATPIARGTVFACTPAAGTGEGPVALGLDAGKNDTANCNTWLGYQAGTGHTTGLGNTSVGWNSARNLILGDDNVAVGNSALEVSSATAFTSVGANTAIGTAALNNTVGCFNTAIGALAGYNQSAGSNNVLIGYLAEGPSTTGDCQLAIGFSSSSYWLTGNSTKAIKPGAGIIDCANSCGTANQVLVSTGSNAVQWANGTTNWTSAGTIQSVGLAATTTAPTIGTAAINQIYYRSRGAKIWEVSLTLEKGVSGTDGSGDYLFTLPNGLQFDTSLVNQRGWTGNVGGQNNDLAILGLQGSTGAIHQNPNVSVILQPVIWSATQYRLIALLSSQYRLWGSGWFNMSAAKYVGTQFQFQST